MDFLAGILVCVLSLLAVCLLVFILFLLNLHWTLAAVKERNRELSPGLVWLMLIPLFHIVWAPIMVTKVANSLRNEFDDRGWPLAIEGFARTAGMVWAWGWVLNGFLSVVRNIARAADVRPVSAMFSAVSCPLLIGILVCGIIFWVQTYQYRNRLQYGGRGYRDGSPEEDYDDEFVRRRPPRMDDEDLDVPPRRRADHDPDDY
jgi:hypothetical protein